MRITTMRQALEAVREKIKDPKHWTQHTNAKNAADQLVPAQSPFACKFCLSGAAMSIEKDSNLHWYDPIYELQKFIPKNFATVAAFNDNRTHAEVMELLDRAIAARPVEA